MVNIKEIPAFSDNYIWLIHDSSEAWVVDPGDSQVVIAALAEIDMPLAGILVTHHHFDHVGGIDDLVHIYQPRVIGPQNPAIGHIDQRVTGGDRVRVCGLEFEVLEVPGHTLDHIAYIARKHQPPLLFCGDTLFAGGCGRVFEGSPPMMHDSLQLLAALPADTRVYCAHEYTLANLAFAAAVEPGNVSLAQRIQRDQAQRQRQLPTVPSTVGEELQTNPFLRCDKPEVVAAAEARTGRKMEHTAEVFTDIRQWKNDF